MIDRWAIFPPGRENPGNISWASHEDSDIPRAQEDAEHLPGLKGSDPNV